MTPFYSDPLVTLLQGDCIEQMRLMEAESVDSIVTDPPAGIAFMSKHWDRDKGGRTGWVAWMTEVMGECYRVLKPGGYALVWSIPRTCHWTAWAMEDAGFVIRDQLAHIFASGFPKGRAQLKPAREDWWLARKPGPMQPLGIDQCRIAMVDGDPGKQNYHQNRAGSPTYEVGHSLYDIGVKTVSTAEHPAGRWPSNVILSSPELFDEPNPWVVGSGATTTSRASDYDWGDSANDNPTRIAHNIKSGVHFGDSGGYSRFFIIPKADRTERERGLTGVNGARGNSHPTVKSLDLMRHLVRLVTPPGGTVLDPFLGSGTTALAASEEGVKCIGIEREAEYLEIAKGRLMATPMGLGLDVPAPTRKQPKPAEYTGIRHPGREWTKWREEGQALSPGLEPVLSDVHLAATGPPQPEATDDALPHTMSSDDASVGHRPCAGPTPYCDDKCVRCDGNCGSAA